MVDKRNDAVTNPYPARILIVEDDGAPTNVLAELLSRHGHHTVLCHDGPQGLLQAMRARFDLVLLDTLRPSLNDFSALQRLRQRSQVPVILISANNSEAERIQGLQHGADDYLPKPLNITELLLRINSLLRRAQAQPPRTQSQLIHGELRLNRRLQQAHYGTTPLTLTALQFRLLWTLAENRGEVLSKPFLYQRVLEKEFCRYDRGLDMHLSRIRRKLVGAGMAADALVTVYGKGYRFE